MPSIADPLLRLIANMTKHEKRYFKLHSTFYNKEKGNSCLKLFETIEKSRPGTHTELVAITRHEPYARQLAVVKNKLTEQILDSLVAYQASPRVQAVLQRLLAHAEVLIEKGLYAHAERLLARAEKKAERSEEDVWLMEIHNRRRDLLIRRVTPDFEENVRALGSRTRATLARIASTVDYHELMDLMQALAARYASTPTPEDRKKMEELIGHPLLRDSLQALSFDAKIACHSIGGTYALLTNNQEQALHHYQSGVGLWREHPALLKEQPARYLHYLFNLLTCLVSGGSESEFAAAVDEARSLCSSGPQGIAQLKEVWNIELLYYINRGDLRRCQEVIRDMEQYMALYADHINPPTFITLCYNCSIYYFLIENYGRVLDYIHTMQNETRIELKRDLQTLSRVFSLVSHFELGNLDILDNMIRSARRYLKKNEVSDELARAVLKWVGVLSGSADHDERNAAYRALRSDLACLLHANADREILGLLELLFWTEGKLARRPVGDIFTEKMASGAVAPVEMFPLELHPLKA